MDWGDLRGDGQNRQATTKTGLVPVMMGVMKRERNYRCKICHAVIIDDSVISCQGNIPGRRYQR
jgi:Pyruvate/2-oxoacid:ferredoxin oxidoreductase delta subunit